MKPSVVHLGLVHGLYYVLTGIWPLLHRRSFEAVTGPKVDFWLARTVGVLVTVIGAALLRAARRERFPPELIEIAAGSALGLAGVEGVAAGVGRIRPIYLLDAAAELAFAALWLSTRAVRPTAPG